MKIYAFIDDGDKGVAADRVNKLAATGWTLHSYSFQVANNADGEPYSWWTAVMEIEAPEAERG